MEHGFRHELKYIIDMDDFSRVRPRIAAVMRSDRHADAAGRYHVRSLYFDDENDSCFLDKVDGARERDKFRIRLYDKSDRTIRFERKAKVGEYVRKESVLIDRRDCQAILNGEPGPLRPAGGSGSRDLYLAFRTRLLRPVIVVDYVREAYVYPPLGVRVTFDMDVAFSAVSADVFNPRLPTVGALRRPALIMEIKYGACLPDFIPGALRGVWKTRQAVSKYAICRESRDYAMAMA